VLLNIEAPGTVVAELERQNRINEDIIRWLTVSVDEHEGGPSVMMRKNERERRRRNERGED
jgi:small subunit ribosomal protein S6